MSFTEHNVNGVIFDTAGTLSVGGVRHAFTTRHGGGVPRRSTRSTLRATAATVRRTSSKTTAASAPPSASTPRAVGCRQIHSDLVRVAREEDAGKLRWDERPYDADALITNVPNLPLFAYGTDCCMITVYDPTSRSIAAIHAGWRGTASGIVLKALVTMMSLYGADPYTMRAAIGPAIGKCCFETDGDVADAFHELMDPAVDERIERRGDKYHIDLKSINRLWLLRSGLDPSRIDVHPDCTKCRPDRYWSHRGMGGERGGMAAVIVLTEDTL